MPRFAWALVLATVVALAQQTGGPPAAPQEPVLRISVNLVQVDAVVTDSHGAQVPNLGADDFEILEDGRPQKITAFFYVKIAAPPPGVANPPLRAGTPGAPPLPSQTLARQQVRRTVVLMVDDLGLSFESTNYVRRALKKFVDDEMREGDLVAIIRTSAGMGSLNQFTTNKRILYEAIDHVRWFPAGRAGISAFPALGSDPLERVMNQAGPGGRPQGRLQQGSGSDLGTRQDFEDERNENFMLGTLGALNFVARALRDLPGRKAVILFSDGIPLFVRGQERTRIVDPMRALTDLANRAAVVVYTIDARGLQTLALTAADDPFLNGTFRDLPEPAGKVGEVLADSRAERHEQYFESQQGLEYLAQQTGGFFIHDNNDLAGGVRRIIEDLSGYYLIGYKPAESSFAPDKGYRQFHKIQVIVKIRGLTVRSRTGYLGVQDQDARPVYQTRNEQIGAALVSPFRANDLKLRLTCLFAEVPKTGAVVRALLHVDARDLTYADEPGGLRKTMVDVIGLVFGEDGIAVDSGPHSGRTITLRLTPEAYAQVLQAGLLFNIDVALKKPGAYQVRVAVRDAIAEKVGSASQFLEVPDVKRHELALSGIVLNGAPPAISEASADKAQETFAVANPNSPAVRVFRPGQRIHYAFVIYNAQLQQKTRRPELETQLFLYHDSKPVFTGVVTPFETAQQSDLTRLIALGTITLGTDLEPGQYMLQIIAWDRLAPAKHQVAAQWTDLEIAR